jgi:hypothetical protein
VSQLTCQLAENHVTLCQFKKIFASWQRFYEALPIFAIGKKSLAERGFGRKVFYLLDDMKENVWKIPRGERKERKRCMYIYIVLVICTTSRREEKRKKDM